MIHKGVTMRIKDVPNLLDYLPDDVKPESDINDLCIIDTMGYGTTSYYGAVLPLPADIATRYTPLTWAINRNLSGVVQLLIESGVDLEKSTSLGETPLMLSKYRKNIQRQLLAAGAKLSTLGKTSCLSDTIEEVTALDTIINCGGSKLNLNIAIQNAPMAADKHHTPLLSAIYHRAFLPQQTAVNAIMNASLSTETGSYLAKDTCEIIERYADFGEKFSIFWDKFPKFVKAEIALHARTAALIEAEHARKVAEREASTKSSAIIHAYTQRRQAMTVNNDMSPNKTSTAPEVVVSTTTDAQSTAISVTSNSGFVKNQK
jgi:ankyrin repeat protein